MTTSEAVPGERLAYRPHLDGLRAIAVLFVFVFHASPGGLPGGFIGVDVFFVLSGYLITRLLVEEWERDGTVSLRRFYARRSRRLVPAVVLLVTVLAFVESVWGSVLAASGRGRQMIATLFYAANWNLVATSDDYFAEGDASPLRHAWSLAVEEQFYLLWPVLLLGALTLAASRGLAPRRALMIGAGVISIASMLLMGVLWEPTAVARVYYGTDTRIFQPLMGAVVGVALSGSPVHRDAGGGRVWDGVAIVSVALIGVAGFTLNGASAVYFRGGAIAVALVTCLLVVALERGGATRSMAMLSSRGLVGLGVISYGFYLWHWPVLLLVRSPAGATFVERRFVNGLQLALTLAIAMASYRLMEDPVRRAKLRPLDRMSPVATVVAGGLVLAFTAALVIGLVVPRGGTVAAPQDAAALAVPDLATSVDGSSGDGLVELTRADRESLALSASQDGSVTDCDGRAPCVIVDGGPGAAVVATVGDSTMQHYGPAIEALARERGFTYVQAAVGGCPVGHRLIATGLENERHKPSNISCFEQTPDVYRELVERWNPRLILATAANERNPHVEDDEVVAPGTAAHLRLTEQALREAVDMLVDDDTSIVLIDLLPYGVGVDCLEAEDVAEACSRSRLQDDPEIPYNAVYQLVAATTSGVSSISLTDLVCEPTVCPLLMGGRVVRYDAVHLTGTASRMFADELAVRLDAVGAPLP